MHIKTIPAINTKRFIIGYGCVAQDDVSITSMNVKVNKERKKKIAHNIK